MINILLIDDEQSWCKSLRRTLANHGLTGYDNIFLSCCGAEAFRILKTEKIDLVLLDLMLGSEMGSDVLKKIKDLCPSQTVVIMTGVNSIHQAAECMKQGAADYLVKNMPVDELISTLRRILKVRELEKENQALKSGYFYSRGKDAFSEFITVNEKMLNIIKYLKAVSESGQPILITGDSGVGKGILAKAAAKVSRPDKPFLSLNVAGLDTQMFSDTLFGHVKGAFTGAESSRQGMIQQAKDGTVFLDEIGDLPVQSQIKLLYLIQDRQYQPLGSDAVVRTGARFICATNQNLESKQKAGEFRRDLFFRLNTHMVRVPSLKERPEDIPVLIDHFIKEAAAEYGKEEPKLPAHMISLLQTYDFPGNVRQLRSMVYDIVARCQGETPRLSDFSSLFESINVKNTGAPQENKITFSYDRLPTAEEMLNDLIDKAMEASGGSQAKAAAMIGISQPTISRRLKERKL